MCHPAPSDDPSTSPKDTCSCNHGRSVVNRSVGSPFDFEAETHRLKNNLRLLDLI